MTKIEKALYYVKKQIEHLGVYVWGGQGEKLKKLTLLKLATMEDTPENAGRVATFVKKNLKRFDKYTKIFDCSGLIICALIYAGLLPKGFDDTAEGIRNKYTLISKAARQAGDLCFKLNSTGKAVHVGILLDKDTVGECKGRDYGVVVTQWSDEWKEVRRIL